MKKQNYSDEVLLNALLSAPTIREASINSGISENTFYLRLRNKDFKQRFNDERLKALDIATSYFQHTVYKAFCVVVDILNNEETPPQIRLNASEILFRNTLKFTEQTNILNRLNQIEQELQNNE